jgi:hypothetical protein
MIHGTQTCGHFSHIPQSKVGEKVGKASFEMVVWDNGFFRPQLDGHYTWEYWCYGSGDVELALLS